VDEYVSATVGKSCLNVGEFWVDMAWEGCDLQPNQNAARQRLCDWINANGHSAPAFDFPTKGILQVCRRSLHDLPTRYPHLPRDCEPDETDDDDIQSPLQAHQHRAANLWMHVLCNSELLVYVLLTTAAAKATHCL
jgi:hypothetical protein